MKKIKNEKGSKRVFFSKNWRKNGLNWSQKWRKTKENGKDKNVKKWNEHWIEEFGIKPGIGNNMYNSLTE